eukprot:TRINITY_DN77028_c0_g1_i1.p1 TRINITY_DN77028_c0_g1~~TRINITY_DN77028_c0_g1_i1.p1  ORF type:complete len:147 (+),score=38.53 TRINITY_DN77028_c0_g1_i1:39-479(+)
MATCVAASEVQNEVTSHDPEVDKAVKLLALIEDFCSGPEFLAGIQEMIAQFSVQIDDREEDHPLEWYEMYQQYGTYLENSLDLFLQEQGISHAMLSDLCDWAREACPDALFSIDYLAAGMEYEAFINLMLDWKQLHSAVDETPDTI